MSKNFFHCIENLILIKTNLGEKRIGLDIVRMFNNFLIQVI